MTSLEQRIPYIAICPAKPENVEEQVSEKDEDDEDVDLFGSDSEASAEQK